jgi:MFS family permease
MIPIDPRTDNPRTGRRGAPGDGDRATTERAEPMRRRRTPPGVLFAVAAVTVTAPRLALAFLAADGVVVPTSWRIDLLAVASIASAVVLTGGTAYLAHAIAVAHSGRGILIALWTAALVCSGALIAPAIVATLRSEQLSAVLGTQRHWSWSICAVLAIDLVASGAMLADARRPPVDRVSYPVEPPGADPVEGVGSPTLTPSPARLPYLCPWGCGRSFGTKDAANGHGRHCPVRAAQRAATFMLAAGATAESISRDVSTPDRHDGDVATPDPSRP